MPFPSRMRTALAAALLVAGAMCGVAQAQPAQAATDDEDEFQASASQAAPPANLPLQDLDTSLLYDFLLGEIAAQRGSPGFAAQTYLALAKRTRDPRVAKRAVELATVARAPQMALDAARVWQDADPASLQALQTLVVLLVQAKRVDETEPYLAKLLAADANAAPNLFLQLNRLLAGSADSAANLRLVRRLAEAHPTVPQAHFAVAQAAAAANDEALALASVRRASALQPDWEMAALYEAQLLQRRSPGEAAKRLAAFLEKYPGSRDVRLHHARMLLLDKRIPEALAEFENIQKRFENDADTLYAAGQLALQSKQFAAAEASMKRVLELKFRDPDAAVYVLGQIAEERKEWARAIDWYSRIQRGELALAARMRTATAIAKQGRLGEARAFLRGVAAQSEPQRVQLLVAESQLLRDANQHKEAFDLLGEALMKTPDQPDLLYDHALTAEKLDRFDVLEANLKRLIQLRPDYAHAYNALGYSFADRNIRLPEAKQLIEKAVELAPDDYFILDSLGWVLYRMGDLKGASTHLRRAWGGRPDGEIGAHFGEVLWMLGERDEARRIWQEALDISPGNDTLQKTLKRFAP